LIVAVLAYDDARSLRTCGIRVCSMPPLAWGALVAILSGLRDPVRRPTAMSFESDNDPASALGLPSTRQLAFRRLTRVRLGRHPDVQQRTGVDFPLARHGPRRS
jgi:hypothetical protein